MKPDEIETIELQPDDEDKRKMMISRLQGKKTKFCKLLIEVPFDNNIEMPDNLVAKFNHPVHMCVEDTLEITLKFTAKGGENEHRTSES